MRLGKRVIAYSAIFCSHIFLQLPEQPQEFRVPGICLGQLGVDLKYQGKGVGTMLIQHSISMAHLIGQYAGCRIIYVEAYDVAMDYYQKLEFRLIERRPNRNRMFLDLFLAPE